MSPSWSTWIVKSKNTAEACRGDVNHPLHGISRACEPDFSSAWAWITCVSHLLHNSLYCSSLGNNSYLHCQQPKHAAKYNIFLCIFPQEAQKKMLLWGNWGPLVSPLENLCSLSREGSSSVEFLFQKGETNSHLSPCKSLESWKWVTGLIQTKIELNV